MVVRSDSVKTDSPVHKLTIAPTIWVWLKAQVAGLTCNFLTSVFKSNLQTVTHCDDNPKEEIDNHVKLEQLITSLVRST